MTKNMTKHESYKEAWRRIKRANQQGFYLEALTLCKSIIADRLLSYVKFHKPEGKIDVYTPFAQLIQWWGKCAQGLSYDEPELRAAVSVRRQNRNAAIHSLVKSEPRHAPKTWTNS